MQFCEEVQSDTEYGVVKLVQNRTIGHDHFTGFHILLSMHIRLCTFPTVIIIIIIALALLLNIQDSTVLFAIWEYIALTTTTCSSTTGLEWVQVAAGSV